MSHLLVCARQAAWQVSYIWAYMHSRGWVLPTVYQGMYNAITRDVERDPRSI